MYRDQIREEKNSMSVGEWEAFFKPMWQEKIQEELQTKMQRLEHCINFTINDTMHHENGEFWIEMEGFGRRYLKKDEPEDIDLFMDFCKCLMDRDTLPGEILELQDCLELL